RIPAQAVRVFTVTDRALRLYSAERLRPPIVSSRSRRGDATGLEQRVAALSFTSRTRVTTVHAEPSVTRTAPQAGARGVVLTCSSATDYLSPAIRRWARGSKARGASADIHIDSRRHAMKPKSVLSKIMAVAATAILSGPAAAQIQTTGTPGSPDATTTIDGRYIPPPPQKFQGDIKLNA